MRARLVEGIGRHIIRSEEPPANQSEEPPGNRSEELPQWLRANLEARSISYAVASRGGGLLAAAHSLCTASPMKPILHDVSASFPSGTLSAVMGPSGAGKSTLLNCLRSGSATSGVLLINGQSYREHGDTRRVIRVIPQDDILLPGLTPFEMLMFAARLSLPASSTAASRLARVRAVLSKLRLSEADAGTRIGSVEKRGLSGGQRKRVSIGLELLADPIVLLVDEPTSGLDATMAAGVASLLREIASSGRTVIATIHQPSSRIFRTFDRLLLIADGRVGFAGCTAAAAAHFGRLGHPIPPGDNPAEALLEALEGGAKTKLLAAWQAGAEARAAAEVEGAESRGAAAGAREAAGAAGVLAPCCGALSTPPLCAAQPGAILGARAVDVNMRPSGADAARRRAGLRTHSVGHLRQALTLTHRALYDAARDTRRLPQALLLRVFIGLGVGLIFQGQCSSDAFDSIFPCTASMFIVALVCTLECVLETVLWFPLSRALLTREYLNGLYSLPALAASLFATVLVQNVLGSICLVLPVYSLVGGAEAGLAALAIYYGTIGMMMFIGSAVGIFVGTLTDSLDEARSLLSPILSPMMLFCGFVLPHAAMPRWISWAYYASFLQYALSILQINQLKGKVFTRGCPAEIVEEALYKDLAVWLDDHAPPGWNITLPRHLGFPGNCSGLGPLREQGLWPVPFGGIRGYFGIMALYLCACVTIAYTALRARIRAQARGLAEGALSKEPEQAKPRRGEPSCPGLSGRALCQAASLVTTPTPGWRSFK